LIIAAAEMALASNVGLSLDAPQSPLGDLFGEDQARYLVAANNANAVLAAAQAAGVPAAQIGAAAGNTLTVTGLLEIPLERLRTAHEGWMPAFMEG
jgi:phosphoribosylformylglycinamidine synthase